MVDWQDGDLPSAATRRKDLAHCPSRAGIRLLRQRLAFPGAHLAWASPRQGAVIYMQRAACSHPAHLRTNQR